MKRSVQIMHEGARLTWTVEDHGDEWEELELEIDGDAMPVLEDMTGGTDRYYAMMRKVDERVREARRSKAREV
ncbi:MAG: hypothetical protein ACLFUM_11995 [Spirochaetaceae bacterium]